MRLKALTSRIWAATVAFCRRLWRGFWRGVLAVHYFNLWDWVARQAYPQEYASSDRYDQFWPGRYEAMTETETYEPGEVDLMDRYSR